jgi:Outer membrane protein (porin)
MNQYAATAMASLPLFLMLSMCPRVNATEIFNKNGNRVQLTGMLDARHQFSPDSDTDGDQSYARFGFIGETKISRSVTGYGKWEYEIKVNKTEGGDDDSAYTRLGYSGIKVDRFGSLDYGRNYGILYDIGAWTDILPVFGNDSYEDTDRFMTGRSSGLLTWRNNDLFGYVPGVSLALQYQGKNSAEDRKSEIQNGDGYGVSVVWNGNDEISLGAALTRSQRTPMQKIDGQGDKADAVTAGIKYNKENILLAANYTRSNNIIHIEDYGWIRRADSWEVVGQYSFDSGVQPGFAWVYTRGHGLKNNTGDTDIVNYVDVNASYIFNSNMSAYIDYKINLINSSGNSGENTLNVPTDDSIGIGIVYQF